MKTQYEFLLPRGYIDEVPKTCALLVTSEQGGGFREWGGRFWDRAWA
ncbi:hypothetical protein [Ferrimicrobium sp.]